MIHRITREPIARARRVEIDLTGEPDVEETTPGAQNAKLAALAPLVVRRIIDENETHYLIWWNDDPDGQRYKDTWEPKHTLSTGAREERERKEAAKMARRSVTPGCEARELALKQAIKQDPELPTTSDDTDEIKSEGLETNLKRKCSSDISEKTGSDLTSPEPPQKRPKLGSRSPSFSFMEETKPEPSSPTTSLSEDIKHEDVEPHFDGAQQKKRESSVIGSPPATDETRLASQVKEEGSDD